MRAANKIVDPKLFSEEQENHFWDGAAISDASSCWEWTRSKTYAGYGQTYVPGDRRPYGAHRVAYALATRLIVALEVVRHKCHNKACVNPSHLATGTVADNVADSVEAGHMTYTPPQLSPDLAEEIRAEREEGVSIYALAEKYGVSTSTISRIASGQTYAAA